MGSSSEPRLGLGGANVRAFTKSPFTHSQYKLASVWQHHSQTSLSTQDLAEGSNVSLQVQFCANASHIGAGSQSLLCSQWMNAPAWTALWKYVWGTSELRSSTVTANYCCRKVAFKNMEASSWSLQNQWNNLLHAADGYVCANLSLEYSTPVTTENNLSLPERRSVFITQSQISWLIRLEDL